MTELHWDESVTIQIEADSTNRLVLESDAENIYVYIIDPEDKKKFERMKHCPLRGIECNGPKCAWWRQLEEQCAVWVGSGK